MGKKYTNFIPQNIAPKTAKNIMVCDASGDTKGRIPLSFLKQPDNQKQYTFCLISDVHIGYDTADTDFEAALTYADANCDFTVISGDLTGSGTGAQLSQYKSIVDAHAKPVYAMTGNHETIPAYGSTERIQQYTGHPLCYSFEQDDDVFIMVGHYGMYHGDGIGWNRAEFVSVEELQWLYETLEKYRNKRCFLFNHVYPWDDGVGDANRLYNGTYWRTNDGAVGQAYHSLLLHYKNVVFFHGHSHLRLHLQDIDKKANYSEEIGYRSVHIPSLSVPRDIVGDSVSYIYAESEGYTVDVYDDYIILNGMDFIDNDKDGNIIPVATYKIDTKLVNVPANTFVDDTGCIQTPE